MAHEAIVPVVPVSAAWGRDLAQRAWRQAQQTAVPLLTATIAAGAGGIDVTAFVVALLGAEAVTLVKFAALELSDFHAGSDPRLWVRVLDRVAPAFGGVLAGVQVTSLADFATVDWAQQGALAGLAAVLALVSSGVDPAASLAKVADPPVEDPIR